MTRSVLVVEDDPIMIAFIEEYLSGSFEYKLMTRADRALSLLKVGGNYSMVLLDLFMPGMNGFEFLEAVRSDRRLHKLPVVVLSGSTNPEDRERALELGANDYIEKPFISSEFEDRLARLFKEVDE